MDQLIPEYRWPRHRFAGQGRERDRGLPTRSEMGRSSPCRVEAPPWRGERGVTLLETVVALALLGVALLMALGLVWQQRRILLRLQATQEVTREVEGTLEALRAGALELPVGTGEEGGALVVASPAAGLPPGVEAAEELSIIVRAELTEPPPDLYRARVEAHYRVLGEPRTLRVETLFWKPGKLKVQ